MSSIQTGFIITENNTISATDLGSIFANISGVDNATTLYLGKVYYYVKPFNCGANTGIQIYFDLQNPLPSGFSPTCVFVTLMDPLTNGISLYYFNLSFLFFNSPSTGGQITGMTCQLTNCSGNYYNSSSDSFEANISYLII
jgi:hypothetical protein